MMRAPRDHQRDLPESTPPAARYIGSGLSDFQKPPAGVVKKMGGHNSANRVP